MALTTYPLHDMANASAKAARALTLGVQGGLVLLLLVALAHTVVLWWARAELQSSGFSAPNKIMYSRLIVPTLPTPETTPPAVAPSASPAPAKPAPRPAAKTRAVQAPPLNAAITETPEVQQPKTLTPSEQEMTAATEEILKSTDTNNSNNKIADINTSKSEINTSSIVDTNTTIWPASTKISYNLSGYYRGDLHGSGSFEWVREGLRAYQLFLRVRSLIGIEYRSRGTIEGDTLMPLRYEEQLPRGVTAVSFNHDTNKVSFSRITDVIDRVPGVQDRASAIMQLVHTASTSPAQLQRLFQNAERIKLPIAGPTGADSWEFEIKGQETIAAESGPVQAWHLQRVPRKPSGDLGVDLWLSEQVQNMPVRIKLTLSTDTYLDLVMSKAEQQ